MAVRCGVVTASLITLPFQKGGWPPSVIEAIVEDDRVIDMRAIDVSGGEHYVYSWKLTTRQRDFLIELVEAEVKRRLL